MKPTPGTMRPVRSRTAEADRIRGPGRQRIWDDESGRRLNTRIDRILPSISGPQRDTLTRYAALLMRWNATFNLLGATSPDDLVDLHLADCLATLPVLARWLDRTHGVDLHDIGSGAGLPGVILAITRPDWTLTLVEPVSKKAAFLRQTVGELRLPQVRVIEGKVEALPPPSATQPRHFICRAFTALERFHSLCRPVSHPDSRLFAMKAAKVHDEIAALPASVPVLAVEPLIPARPELERTLVVMAARASTPN